MEGKQQTSHHVMKMKIYILFLPYVIYKVPFDLHIIYLMDESQKGNNHQSPLFPFYVVHRSGTLIKKQRTLEGTKPKSSEGKKGKLLLSSTAS